MPKTQHLTAYIIAETAYNHEGDRKYLYQMIEEIATLRLNAVKFHLLLNLDSYMKPSHPLYQQMKKWMFTQNQWNEILSFAAKKKLDVVALCDDVESIRYIISKKKQVSYLELHATSLNDFFMLREAAAFNGPIILGIGGSSINDISYAIDFLRHHGKQDIILMYGFQSYPTNYADINLAKMHALQHLFHLPIGYADHTKYNDPNNVVISIAAAMMGFPILEKHYTLDPGKERIDYHAAVGKKQMGLIRDLMNLVIQLHGSGQITLSEPEKAYGNIGPMKKAIVAKRDIKKGETLSQDNLWFKRTPEESSIQQKQFLQLLGSKAKVDMKKDEVLDFSKIEYKFKTLNLDQFTNIKK
ncbi:MAG: N-acetylneuraminate synthase family protein [Candidatus Thermoplasmatota archaeon]|nr:N-acetylneuraminate synthase family protein [Candidatus Thermoplasmatota archaeon]